MLSRRELNRGPHALVLLVLGGGIILHASPAGADDWKKFRANAAKVKSIRAEFVQKKELKILARPLISRGWLYFKAPSSVRWEYSSPIKTVSLVHKGKARRFGWSRAQRKFVQDSSSKIEKVRMVIEQITGWLSGRVGSDSSFKVTRAKGSPPRIILSPRASNQKRFIERVEITYSARLGVIQSVTIVENKRASTLLEFQNIELNKKFPESLFKKCD